MTDFAPLPSTVWTAIARVKQGDRAALEELVGKYRPPILAFVRSTGAGAEEAEDVTQEVFLTVVRDDVISKADSLRGRFRSLLLAVARHTIAMSRRDRARLKRGGGRPAASLDAGGGGESAGLHDVLAAPEPDPGFDALWVANLVRRGMEQLRQECERDGKPHFKALLMHVDERLDYAQIAERTGLSPGDVKNCIYQARVVLKRHVLREIQDYSLSREEYDEEVAYLMRFVE